MVINKNVLAVSRAYYYVARRMRPYSHLNMSNINDFGCYYMSSNFEEDSVGWFSRRNKEVLADYHKACVASSESRNYDGPSDYMQSRELIDLEKKEESLYEALQLSERDVWSAKKVRIIMMFATMFNESCQVIDDGLKTYRRFWNSITNPRVPLDHVESLKRQLNSAAYGNEELYRYALKDFVRLEYSIKAAFNSYDDHIGFLRDEAERAVNIAVEHIVSMDTEVLRRELVDFINSVKWQFRK